MNLSKQRQRDRLIQRLHEGSDDSRRRTARRALFALARYLQRVRDEKAAAQARFDALREASGESIDGPVMINPVARRKSLAYKVGSAVVLAVEIGLATYTASLTIGGGLFLHVLAGVLATLLFCGLAKLATVAQVSTWSLRTSAERLEIQLRWTVGAAAAMLGMFFVLRFFEQAALAFAIVSSFLSFAVAYIAALAWELSDLLGAANREVTSFTRLSWLEAEFVRLEAITRQVLELSDRRLPSARAAGIAAVSGLLLCLLPPSLQADPLQHYHLWIDVSGSMAQQEYERLRMVLEDPMPFIASRSVTSLALSSFFSERDALSGPQHLWPIPQHEVPDCTPSETVFTASRRAQEDACAQRRFEALEVWQQEVRQTLDRFRQVLAAIPIDQAKPETCLFPVLDRVASASHASMVITDGGHAACGGSPKEPREVSGRAVIVLVPDRGGSGLLERMARRRSEIERLYPGIVVTESWQVTDGELWESIGAPDLPAER